MGKQITRRETFPICTTLSSEGALVGKQNTRRETFPMFTTLSSTGVLVKGRPLSFGWRRSHLPPQSRDVMRSFQGW